MRSNRVGETRQVAAESDTAAKPGTDGGSWESSQKEKHPTDSAQSGKTKSSGNNERGSEMIGSEDEAAQEMTVTIITCNSAAF